VFACDTIQGRRVRDAHIEHFSGANHVIKSSHDLLDRSHEIPGMNPIEVDVVGLEPLEAGLKGAGHVLAVIAARVGIALAREERVFCGDDEVVPVGFNEFAQQALTRALVIFVGGVDEIAAGLRETVKDFSAFFFRCGEAPVFPGFPESHRAQAKLGDPEPAFS